MNKKFILPISLLMILFTETSILVLFYIEIFRTSIDRTQDYLCDSSLYLTFHGWGSAYISNVFCSLHNILGIVFAPFIFLLTISMAVLLKYQTWDKVRMIVGRTVLISFVAAVLLIVIFEFL